VTPVPPNREAAVLTGDQRTPFDLNFSLFNIPVRVSPFFWLVTVFLAGDLLRAATTQGLLVLLVWVACVFLSILVHELGHALTAQAFGNRPSILLYGFGGLAFHQHLPQRWQRIAVILAGPAAGFLLAAAVYALTFAMPQLWAVDYLGVALAFLLGINIVWGLINLLPVYPLDGGQFTAEVFSAVLPGSGRMLAFGLSLVVAGGLVVISLLTYLRIIHNPYFSLGMFSILIFGMLAFDSYVMLQAELQRRRRWSDDRLPWERNDRW
jgi:Zn-dependent protease